ncbi:unnamed protein product [Rotaria sordida]|uniref:Uncharacterized protein n=1 Tax=Rotaria sordida TaxID=392033 RepID=A0A813VJV3_9BILA|nr:unnamed protein product [Rotaria sordida]CAF3553919.1 unnamed protein product [Rotaria sordida]
MVFIKNFGFNFDRLLAQQAKVLIHLKIDRIVTLNYIDTQFSIFTHLIIDGGFLPNDNCYIRFSNKYKNADAALIFQYLGSSITHLYFFIDREY